MTSPRLMTSVELGDALGLTALDLEKLKDAGAPARVVDGAERWHFGDLVAWLAEMDAERWEGIVP